MKPGALLFAIVWLSAMNITSAQTVNPSQAKKIQVAILLDVSNSMDGLIAQAKAQLWNMVTVLGRAECQGKPPAIEIALYEYGRTSNDRQAGYVKQLSPFTTDLDKLSATLFNLTTNGGDEYCGQVILSSLDQLQWDASPGNYKVIFIAGNEDFLQGKVSFTDACTLAKQKGVIVNTIYCGEKAQGIREHWNLGTECGQGSYTSINADAQVEDIPTPYDSAIYVLNRQLNQTYIAYGAGGAESFRRQAEMDEQNASLSRKAGLGRVSAKASRGVYDNRSWDLVDAYNSDSTVLAKLDQNTLAPEYRTITRRELGQKVKENAATRQRLQQQIGKLAGDRSQYIQAENKRRNNTEALTLEAEVEKILKEQAKRFGMVIAEK